MVLKKILRKTETANYEIIKKIISLIVQESHLMAKVNVLLDQELYTKNEHSPRPALRVLPLF